MPATRTRRIIDDAGAEAVLAAAERKAAEEGYRVVIAVVDPWGELVALRRTPGAQIASSRVAVDKARTAAIFVRPSREIEAQVSRGRLGALALHGAVALTGGIPLVVEDESVSLAGAAASFSTTTAHTVTYDGARLAAEATAAVATERAVYPVAAIVDAGGKLVYLWRPDRAQVASVDV